jgi:hypothetical protein
MTDARWNPCIEHVASHAAHWRNSRSTFLCWICPIPIEPRDVAGADSATMRNGRGGVPRPSSGSLKEKKGRRLLHPEAAS